MKDTCSCRYRSTLLALLGSVLLTPALLPAQESIDNRFPVLTPESAIHHAADRGVRQHTHLRVLLVSDASSAAAASFNTPSTIRSAYSLPATGGSNAIAIVDAFDYPTALKDFNTFSQQFGLPQETATSATGAVTTNAISLQPGLQAFRTPARQPVRRNPPARGTTGSGGGTTPAPVSNTVFQVVYASGTRPQSGGNAIASWNLEEALDIEWAHAMAPGAKIYLVEAASDSTNDLMYAVHVASTIAGVKEVSMSWGGNEWPSESAYDSYFQTPGIVYIASGGDTSAEMEYPAASPYVVAAGGTSLNRNAQGQLLSETAWSDTGCGSSAYEPRPSYQNGVVSVVGPKRGVADMAFDANPNTGVNIYDSTPYYGSSGWWILGGTSVSAPSLAGVINLAASANGFAAGTVAEEGRLYGNLLNPGAFRDITSGTDGPFSCTTGWDFITGVGSPLGLSGK